MAKTRKDWFSFSSPSWENTYAFPKGRDEEDLDEAASTLSQEAFGQEYGAEFTSMSGRVYADFDREKNVGYYPYIPLYPVYSSADVKFVLQYPPDINPAVVVPAPAVTLGLLFNKNAPYDQLVPS